MKSFRCLAAVAALVMSAPAGLAGQTAPALTVRAVRFWIPEYRQTLVKAFVQIPYIVLTPTSDSPDGVMSYRVTVRVADSTGFTLMHESWVKRVPSGAHTAGATGLEVLEFAVTPGQFRLELTVDDSVSGAKIERSVSFQGFDDSPGSSDLVIAPKMRVPSAGDTIPMPGELRRGNTVFTAAADIQLSPIGDRSKLFYYLEVYSAGADSGTLTLEIKDAAGARVLLLPARPVQVSAGGGVVRGQLDLTGLPEGPYQVAAALQMGGRTILRTAPFQMGSLEKALAQEARDRELWQVSDTGYFGAMFGDQLDEAFAPLSYISNANDRLGVWSPNLSISGKRNFLAGFWAGRDPTPGTPKNEVREAFYGRIAEANRRFTDEQVGSRPGWRTDMGRIFIRNGDPTETLRRAQMGAAAPYQVWRFSGARNLWYIFVDRSGFGSYELVTSTDPKEPSRAGWEGQLGGDVINDISRFLNVDLIRRSRSNTQ